MVIPWPALLRFVSSQSLQRCCIAASRASQIHKLFQLLIYRKDIVQSGLANARHVGAAISD